MARINIEQSIYSDFRFLKLIQELGSVDAAIGSLVRAWTVAQQFWIKDKSRIPKEVWINQNLNEALLRCALVRFDDNHNGYYVCGSEEQFAWLTQKQDAGKKGGLKSGNSRRSKINNLERSKRKQTEANSSGANPLPLPLPLSPTHTHSLPQLCKESKNSSNSSPDKIQPLIARYCEVWKLRYGGSAPIGGKTAGQLKSLVKDFGLEKSISYVESYLEMPDQWFIMRRHDIPTLLSNLNAVAQFMETGRIVTKREINQIDQTISTQNLIDEIRRNGI